MHAILSATTTSILMCNNNFYYAHMSSLSKYGVQIKYNMELLICSEPFSICTCLASYVSCYAQWRKKTIPLFTSVTHAKPIIKSDQKIEHCLPKVTLHINGTNQ